MGRWITALCAGRAKPGLIEIMVHDLRAFTTDRHRTVDDRPFGGGEGMVLKPEPHVRLRGVTGSSGARRTGQRPAGETVILLSPHGQHFYQAVAEELARNDRIVIDLWPV